MIMMNKLQMILTLVIASSGMRMGVLTPGINLGLRPFDVFHLESVVFECLDENDDPIDCDLTRFLEVNLT